MYLIINENIIFGASTEERFLTYVQRKLKLRLSLIDEGSDGIVYAISPKEAIKFSNTPPEEESKMVGKSIAGFVQYYGVGKLILPSEIIKDNDFQFLNRAIKNKIKNNSEDILIYWTRMERLSQPPLRPLEAIDDYLDGFEAQHPTSFHQNIFNFIMNADDKTKNEFLAYIGDKPSIIKRYTKGMYTIADSLKANRINYTDFRLDQLGVDSDGNLKLFDFTEV